MEKQQAKLQWYWLYRDFLRAYEQCPSDDLWMETYSQKYLRLYSHLLTPLHFQPKGFATEEQVLARITQLGRQHFSPLAQAIECPDTYEQALKGRVHHLLTVLHHQPHNRDIYVVVGLNCTNIYSLIDQQRDVTILCLENVQGQLEEVYLLLAHEVHHWARQTSFTNLFTATLGERLVTEGLAAAFSEEVCPGKSTWEYCFVSPDTVDWVQNHWSDLEVLLSRDQLHENSLLDPLFARQPAISLLPTIPPRVGYVYGYLKVKAYLQILDRRASESVELPWEQVGFA